MLLGQNPMYGMCKQLLLSLSVSLSLSLPPLSLYVCVDLALRVTDRMPVVFLFGDLCFPELAMWLIASVWRGPNERAFH